MTNLVIKGRKEVIQRQYGFMVGVGEHKKILNTRHEKLSLNESNKINKSETRVNPSHFVNEIKVTSYIKPP